MSVKEKVTKKINISNLQTAHEHRDSILNKVDHYLAVVSENVSQQPSSEEQEALQDVINNIHLFARILRKVKGKEEFIKVSSYLNEVLYEEFFSKFVTPEEEE